MYFKAGFLVLGNSLKSVSVNSFTCTMAVLDSDVLRDIKLWDAQVASEYIGFLTPV